MQHDQSAPYPPPDVYPAWAHSRSPELNLAPAKSQQNTHALPTSDPDFLIVGLFALRLARKLIHSLDYYPEREDDIRWLDCFLEPYHPSYDLAKLTSAIQRSYTQRYPEIVSRMVRQPKYPLRFMAMNALTQERQETSYRPRELNDNDRLEMINFVHAAEEWGSTVLVPQHEAKRMMEVAGQRRVADLERAQHVEGELLPADKFCTDIGK